MANVTTLAKGGSGVTAVSERVFTVHTHEVDIAAATAAGLTTGGYVVVATIPADTLFELVQVENATALDLDSGSSQRIDLGDATDDDEFVTNATTEAAGTNHTITKATFTGGRVISASDTLRLKLTGDKLAGGTADATGVIRLVWLQADCSRNQRPTSSIADSTT